MDSSKNYVKHCFKYESTLFIFFRSLPVWLSWLQYISWFKYSNEILVVNQWRNVTFDDCDHNNPDYPPNCVASGEEIFAQLNFEEVIIAALFFYLLD